MVYCFRSIGVGKKWWFGWCGKSVVISVESVVLVGSYCVVCLLFSIGKGRCRVSIGNRVDILVVYVVLCFKMWFRWCVNLFNWLFCLFWLFGVVCWE